MTTNKIKKKRRISFVLAMNVVHAAFLCVLFSGCGRQSAPSPPLERAELTLELFDSLKNEQYRTAINKIIRLRQIDKHNVYLAKLENLERDNLVIKKAQELLDQNNPDEALELIERTIRIEGPRDALIDVKKELIFLRTIEKIIGEMKTPKDAFHLAKNAVTLRKLMAKYPPAKTFEKWTDATLDTAIRMHQFEKQRAIFHLSSTLEALIPTLHPDNFVLFAELEVENPRHFTLKKKKRFIEDFIGFESNDPR